MDHCGWSLDLGLRKAVPRALERDGEEVSFCSGPGLRDTDNKRSSVDLAVRLITPPGRNLQNQSPGSIDYAPVISFPISIANRQYLHHLRHPRSLQTQTKSEGQVISAYDKRNSAFCLSNT